MLSKTIVLLSNIYDTTIFKPFRYSIFKFPKFLLRLCKKIKIIYQNLKNSKFDAFRSPKMANTSAVGGMKDSGGSNAAPTAAGGKCNALKKPPIGSASWSYTDNEPDTKYDHAWSIAKFSRKVTQYFQMVITKKIFTKSSNEYQFIQGLIVVFTLGSSSKNRREF